MKRFSLDHLAQWVKSPHRKPLILRGARQVGKSTLVKLFCQRDGYDLLELNLERVKLRQAENRETFSMQKLIDEIELLAGKEITESTILFLDEIQGQPAAIEVLRYFYEERPELRVIAAGSLLEATMLRAHLSMPVGRVEYFHLGPMTFREFLYALGEDLLVKKLDAVSLFDPPAQMVATRALELLQLYYVVGGMPEAVRIYAEERDIKAVREVHYALLQSYRDDIPKYANTQEGKRVDDVFHYAPAHLGELVVLKDISQAHSLEVRRGIELLSFTQVIHAVYHNVCSGTPLQAGKRERPLKLYFCDVGLYCTASGLTGQDLLLAEPSKVLLRGNIAEQFIAQHLAFRNPSHRFEELFFWVRDGKTSSAEVDFIVSNNGRIIPIEVKAGATGKLRSLWQFVAEKEPPYAVRFYGGSGEPLVQDVVQQVPTKSGLRNISTKLVSLPLYMVESLTRLIREMET